MRNVCLAAVPDSEQAAVRRRECHASDTTLVACRQNPYQSPCGILPQTNGWRGAGDQLAIGRHTRHYHAAGTLQWRHCRTRVFQVPDAGRSVCPRSALLLRQLAVKSRLPPFEKRSRLTCA